MKRNILWVLLITSMLGCGVAVLPFFLCGCDSPTHVDAIVVLGGGPYTKARLQEGLRLVQEGYATNLVVSGLEYDPQNPNFSSDTWSLLQDNAQTLHVVVDGHSRITRDTGLFVRQLAPRAGWKNVIAVTSEWHWRRTRSLFLHDCDGVVGVRICTVRDVDVFHWWNDPRAVRLLRREFWFYLTFTLFRTSTGIYVLAALVLVTTVVIVIRRRLIP